MTDDVIYGIYNHPKCFKSAQLKVDTVYDENGRRCMPYEPCCNVFLRLQLPPHFMRSNIAEREKKKKPAMTKTTTMEKIQKRDNDFFYGA